MSEIKGVLHRIVEDDFGGCAVQSCDGAHDDWIGPMLDELDAAIERFLGGHAGFRDYLNERGEDVGAGA